MLCNGATSVLGTALNTFFTNLSNILSFVVASMAVVFIIFAGILWMSSNGNFRQVETAKGALQNVGIGLVIIVAAKLIVGMLVTAMGCPAPA